MEPLKPLPFIQWTKLLDSLKRDWPTYSWYYNWTAAAIKCKTIDPSLPQEIYCPDGDPTSGVFVGILTESGIYTVTNLFSFKENQECLKKCLLETKIIDWTAYTIFPFIHESFYPVADQVFQEKQKFHLKMNPVTDLFLFYWKSKEDCTKLKIEKIPEGFELRPLQKSNIPLINSVWPYRNKSNPTKSEKFLTLNLKYNFRNVGLFKKDDDSLVAWVFYGVIGILQALQTLDEYKRRGFGKLVLKALIKELALKDDIEPTLFIVDKNVASISLFESLGFKFCANTYRVIINYQ